MRKMCLQAKSWGGLYVSKKDLPDIPTSFFVLVCFSYGAPTLANPTNIDIPMGFFKSQATSLRLLGQNQIHGETKAWAL